MLFRHGKARVKQAGVGRVLDQGDGDGYMTSIHRSGHFPSQRRWKKKKKSEEDRGFLALWNRDFSGSWYDLQLALDIGSRLVTIDGLMKCCPSPPSPIQSTIVRRFSVLAFDGGFLALVVFESECAPLLGLEEEIKGWFSSFEL